ncbi:caspase family protein [Magnetovibrio sp. PR-2]|uniref:caspase family protein n=1 Tax=Magnetovibrio sp. PR-2 TaxID=3120356 RepID=UPI002FCE3CAB
MVVECLIYVCEMIYCNRYKKILLVAFIAFSISMSFVMGGVQANQNGDSNEGTANSIWDGNTSFYISGHNIFRFNYPFIEKWHWHSGQWRSSRYDLSSVISPHFEEPEKCELPGKSNGSQLYLLCQTDTQKLIFYINDYSMEVQEKVNLDRYCAGYYQMWFRVVKSHPVLKCMSGKASDKLILFTRYLELMNEYSAPISWLFTLDENLTKFISGWFSNQIMYEHKNDALLQTWLGGRAFGGGLAIYLNNDLVIEEGRFRFFVRDIHQPIRVPISPIFGKVLGAEFLGRHLVFKEDDVRNKYRVVMYDVTTKEESVVYSSYVRKRGNLYVDGIYHFASDSLIVTPDRPGSGSDFSVYKLGHTTPLLKVIGSDVFVGAKVDKNIRKLTYLQLFNLYEQHQYSQKLDMEEVEEVINKFFSPLPDWRTPPQCRTRPEIVNLSLLHSLVGSSFPDAFLFQAYSRPVDTFATIITNRQYLRLLNANADRFSSLAALMLKQRDKVLSTDKWQNKFNGFNPMETGLEQYREAGFPITTDSCLLNSNAVQGGLEYWMYSFWYRRYLDGSFERVSSILEAISTADGLANTVLANLEALSFNNTPPANENSVLTGALPANSSSDNISLLGTFHALVIGNNQYHGSGLAKLQTAVNDATEVGRVLNSRYGFDVTYLNNASRADIITSLDKYRSALGEGDSLLIYYAGHGWLDEQAERGYWLPVDASADNRVNWLSNADITDTLKALKAKRVMVVADSCYSGTLTRSATRGISVVQKDATFYDDLARKTARTVLSSGGLEPVDDSRGGKHSVFAKAFINALNDNTATMDGTQLFANVREQVRLNARQTPQYQNIRFAGHEVGGDFLFVKKQ